MKKLKKMILYLLSFLLLLGVVSILFININPAFDGNPTKEQKEMYHHFNNYVDGKFVNEVPTDVMNSSDASSTNEDSASEAKDRNPTGPIPVSAIDWNKIKSENDSLTWFGHSAFLLSIDNKKLLIDPMLSPIASPVSLVGIKRYNYSEDIMLHLIDEMPPIDAVFITHDHYDHLDYQSIVKLNSKVSHFFVPLGVSANLIRWGIPKEKNHGTQLVGRNGVPRLNRCFDTCQTFLWKRSV